MSAFGVTMHQARCLAYIATYIAAHGFSPSYAEIGATLGLKSKSQVHRVVVSLKQRGHIDYIPHSSRSIVIKERAA